jgi:hypothetical protein
MANKIEGIPSWAKGVIAVVATGLVVVGVVYGIKGIKKAIKNKASKDESKSVKGDLADLNNNVITKQTISNAQASGFAGGLYSAMNGVGTDVDAILNIFKKVNNDADVLAIVKAYGTKSLTSTLLWESETFNGQLSGALRDELDSSDVNKINKILSDKGIGYQF